MDESGAAEGLVVQGELEGEGVEGEAEKEGVREGGAGFEEGG